MAVKVFDGRGQLLEVSAPLAKGGEGSFCTVHKDPLIAVKIYHKDIKGLEERGRKLSLMVRHPSPEVKALAAWPIETVTERPGGPVIGFVMDYARGYREAHFVYGIKDRKVHFPKADWRFLIRAASNMARAFAVVHSHGHVIGDVNHSSVMISPDATVKLIDCDSWQVTLEGQSFRNLVGEALHTAPELQGKNLSSVTRTTNHDLFGLAVLIFELLFMGRHPFMGRYSGKGDPGLEDNIREFRFAYGPGAASRQMSPPPGSLPLESASPKLASLFGAAFSPEGVKSRPPASAWITALDALFSSLAKCPQNDAHYFWKEDSGCPWCRIEALTGVTLFNPVFTSVPNGTGGFDLALVWRSIEAVPSPGSVPSPNPIRMQIAPDRDVQRKAERRRWTLLSGVLVIALICVGLGMTGLSGLIFWVILFGLVATVSIANSQVEAERRRCKALVATTQNQASIAQARWSSEAQDVRFKEKLLELQQCRSRHENLPKVHQQRLQILQSTIREHQLHAFLDRFLIASAKIPGIGPARCATLRSYGIESAADLDNNAIMSVPGFGPSYTSKLLQWHRTLEAQFRFDPSKGVDPTDIAKVEQEIANTRAALERDLRAGANALAQIARQIETSRQVLRPVIEAALGQLAQAETNLKALSAI